MKVQDLIEQLEDLDPEAQVYLMTQRDWPFEQRIVHVAIRENFEDVEDEECRDPSEYPARKPDDVFIVAGDQIRYGNKNAWSR